MIPGFRIVLTASRAEMSQYGPEVGDPADAFLAFCGTFPRPYVNWFLRKFLTPMNEADGRARFAPYSLRKIEAALSGHGGADEVIVCHPDNLRKFVGYQTEVVGITTMDPFGLGYVSVTYNSLFPFGRETVNESEFRRLLNQVASLKKKHPFKVVVGGEGTWQIERSNLRTALGPEGSDPDAALHHRALLGIQCRILGKRNPRRLDPHRRAGGPRRGPRTPADGETSYLYPRSPGPLSDQN